MQTRIVILVIFSLIGLPSMGAVQGKGFPTRLGSYKDPRSSKEHVVCGLVTTAERFKAADTVFFGKFLNRNKDFKKKVFQDEFRVIKAWKGTLTEGQKIIVEVPPPSDFCTTSRIPTTEGEKATARGGVVVFAKGAEHFLDCCMTEVNDSALSDKRILDSMDSDFQKLKNTL